MAPHSSTLAWKIPWTEEPGRLQSMMTRLVETYDIDEVKVYEPSLNDIFVEYAGDAAQED